VKEVKDLKRNKVTDVTTGTRGPVRDFLGLERNVVVMVVAGSLQDLGQHMWLGYLSKVLEALGATGKLIGAFGTVGSLTGTVSPYLGGLVSDRLGRGRALILASALALAGYLIYVAAPVWWLFIPGVVLLGLAGSFKFMGSLALTGDRLREERRAISIGVQNVIGRTPWIISPPLGGLLMGSSLGLLLGFRVAVGVTIVLTGGAIFLQHRYYQLPPPDQDDRPLHPIAVLRSMPGELQRLLLAESLVWFGRGMSDMFMILYVMKVFRVGLGSYGLLLGLATATSVVMYVPVSKLADRAGRASRRPFVAATFLFAAMFPLALLDIGSAAWLVPVFILRGLKEFGEPARKALILDLLPQASRGRQMGVYYTLRAIALFPAPLVGGLLWDWNYAAPFCIGGLVSGLGVLWFVLEGMLFRSQAEQE